MTTSSLAPPPATAPAPAEALTVAEATSLILQDVRPVQPEHVSLPQALGRTLAHDLAAALTNPPFDASSMDGYAVRAADVASVPAVLALTGESAAGWPHAGSVGAKQAVRIFTGAPVPDGADCIVIQENAEAADGRVRVLEAGRAGTHIRYRGQDFHEGDIVLRAGTRLGARHILLAASAGHAMLAVTRKPKVAILATGDELVEPSDLPRAGQIVSSNTYGIAAMVEAAGGEPLLLGIARDTEEDLAQKFDDARGADVLLTLGGASVGDHDLVRPVLEKAGARLAFHKIAMRPGKPAFFGDLKGMRVLGLPGNPLAAMITARLFLVPLLACLSGRTEAVEIGKAKLAAPLPANGPRTHYMRATLEGGALAPRVSPLHVQDSAFIKALNDADCLIVVPANSPALPAGSEVDVIRLDF